MKWLFHWEYTPFSDIPMWHQKKLPLDQNEGQQDWKICPLYFLYILSPLEGWSTGLHLMSWKGWCNANPISLVKSSQSVRAKSLECLPSNTVSNSHDLNYQLFMDFFITIFSGHIPWKSWLGFIIMFKANSKNPRVPAGVWFVPTSSRVLRTKSVVPMAAASSTVLGGTGGTLDWRGLKMVILRVRRKTSQLSSLKFWWTWNPTIPKHVSFELIEI